VFHNVILCWFWSACLETPTTSGSVVKKFQHWQDWLDCQYNQFVVILTIADQLAALAGSK
jgi:hypothetical protein